jgi:uncharacterized protein
MPGAIPPFTETHAALLRTFLSSPERPSGTLTYPQLAGFLFSMANGPDLIPPSEWMPMAFNDQEAGYESLDEAEQVLQAMMALYNECARDRTTARAALPSGCEILPQPLDNLAEEASLSQWAQGFAMGHDYVADIWDECTPDELDGDLGSVLMVLTFFASPKLAEAYRQEAKSQSSLDEMAHTVATLLPDAMREYAHLGRAIYQARREAGETGPEPGSRPRIGRNDPCPCGSGRKFKKCCGAN